MDNDADKSKQTSEEGEEKELKPERITDDGPVSKGKSVIKGFKSVITIDPNRKKMS